MREFEFFYCFFDGVVFCFVFLFGIFWEVEVEFWVEYLFMFFFGGNVVLIYLWMDGDMCYIVFFLNFFWCVLFSKVGIYFVFGKGSIDMFFVVIVELVDFYFWYFMLLSVSLYLFGVDFIFFCNFFGCVIFGDVEVVFCN